MTAPLSPDEDVRATDLHDLITHRAAWRNALVIAREHAEVSPPDVDDKGYWQHEIDVFDRTFAALSTPVPEEGLPHEERCGCTTCDCEHSHNGFGMVSEVDDERSGRLAAEAENVALRQALGAHIQADAYRDSFPDDDADLASNRQSEAWWRLKAREWTPDGIDHECAEAAKARILRENGNG